MFIHISMVLSLYLFASPSVEKGKIVLIQAEKKVAEEKYQLKRDKDKITLSSSIFLTLPSMSLTMDIEMEANPDLTPIKYSLQAETPAGTQMVEMTKLDSVKYEITGMKLGTHQSKEVKAKNAIIVDNNVMSQFVLLGEIFPKDKEEILRTAIIPQVMMTIPLKIKRVNKVVLLSWKDSIPAEHYRVFLGDIAIDLYKTEEGVVGGEIPVQKARFYRIDIFPKGFVVTSYKTKKTSNTPGKFNEKEIHFNSKDGTELYGTLMLPEGFIQGETPLVLFIHGSGGVDRNENAPGFETNIFRDLAYGLAKSGIASLRYDKRGIGKSKGDFRTAALTDLVDDAKAAVNYLKNKFPDNPVFLLGHSEGGIIASLIAKNTSLNGIILIATPATPLDKVILYQIRIGGEARNIPDSLIEEHIRETKEFFDFVRSSTGDWENYPDSVITKFPKEFSLKWWREHLNYEPNTTFGKIRIPVLIIQGDKDPQIPVEHAEMIAKMLKGSGNPKVDLKIIHNLNHLLRYNEGTINTLAQGIDKGIDKRVIEIVSKWIWGNVKG